jgi:hypothetical protein
MSKPPSFYLIKGGLTDEQHGIYRLREPQAAAPAAERWPRDGEWRRLIRSLIRNPTKGE